MNMGAERLTPNSSDGDVESYVRSGLNASEAATAWAVVHFGGDIDACERLQGGIGDLIRDVVEPVVGLEEREQFNVLERWREEDRAWDRLDGLLADCEYGESSANDTQSDARWANAYALICEAHVSSQRRPWRRAHSRTRRAIEWLAIGDRRESIPMIRPELRAREGFDLAIFSEMPRRDLELFIRQLGVYQLAELSYQQPRRNLVRLRQRLLAADRRWFDYCAFHSKHIDDEGRVRIHKLFRAISTEGAGMASYLSHIGLYSVAVATQIRFGHQIRHLLDALPAQFAQPLSSFARRAATMPVVINDQLRVTVDDFTEQWRDYYAELGAENLAHNYDENLDKSEA